MKGRGGMRMSMRTVMRMSGRSAGGKYKIFKTCMAVMFKSMVKTRVAVRSHLKSSSVVTGGNWSTRNKPAVFGRTKLEAVFSSAT